MDILSTIFTSINTFLWGDLIVIPLPGGSQIGLSLLVMILIPAGIYFTLRTRFLPFRLFPDMIKITTEKRNTKQKNSISGVQALIISTATRVGMGNLIGVVAAISLGGAGAVFWMWITALLGSSTAFIEGTLSQLYKQPDPLYGGYRGGPSYYLHSLFAKGKKKSILAILFALSALLCFCGISSIIGNSVSSSFYNAFQIPPLYSTILLVGIIGLILLRNNTSVKVLDIVVPIMAVLYILITIIITLLNITKLPSVLYTIFSEAFGFKQAVAGGFGAVLMNGAKRGLFSNEAGSGSAPCAAAAAETTHPAKIGLLQSFGVFIDTIVICTCTAMIMLLTPSTVTSSLTGMSLLQSSMEFHLGGFGGIFIAVILALFCFSTFLGLMFYARSNIAYLFGDNWTSQNIYKIFSLVMLFVGGLSAYSFVWDLGDIGIGLMTIFNMLAIIPLAPKALASLEDYERKKKNGKME